jgi:branched-chain amino acid transport system ATP-binding protein
MSAVYESRSLLDVQNLNAGYGRSQVLFDMTMMAPAKGAIAILGRNGVGKSTLLKTIAGELPAMDGVIWFDNRHAIEDPAERRARNGIGYVPQEHAIFGKLTVLENLQLGAVRQGGKGAIDYVLDFFPKLSQRLAQTAATLSGGERKMLAIGRALLGKPKLLMLDEPTEGVWIGVIEEIADRLAQLSREMGVILVEQHVELALRTADYVYVIDHGTVALEGRSADIRDNPMLIKLLSP